MKIAATIDRKALDKKLSNMRYKELQVLLDGRINQIAAYLLSELSRQSWLRIDSKYRTGHTGRMWKLVKVHDSLYRIQNFVKTKDRNYLVAELLNYGNNKSGLIKPKKSKFLYVPISKRAMRKRLGAAIPKTWIRASKATAVKKVDYALTKRVRPFTGTRFIERETGKALAALKLLLRSI